MGGLNLPAGPSVLLVPVVLVKSFIVLEAHLVYLAPMPNEKKDQRIPIMMSPSEVALIDEWRAKQPGLPARAEAIRRLVQTGLKAGG